MTRLESLRAERDRIIEVAHKRGVVNLRVFGSVAKGTDADSSDLDLLVDLEPERNLFDLGGLLVDLEELLQCKVDLVTEAGLHWMIRETILREAVRL
jgi:predicted nucleotidyltransferase